MKAILSRHFGYGLLFLGGLSCFGLAFHQYHYMQLIEAGNQALAEQRFDSQEYEQASRFWFARQDVLLFNQSVLAYKAQNFTRAADQLRRVAQMTSNRKLRAQALYNLGVVVLEFEEAEGAAEMFKEALRNEPQDTEAKFNLERLYQWVLLKEGDHGEASLKQAPGVGKDQGKGNNAEGAGRSNPKADI